MYGYIYQTTNIVTQKVYIGKHKWNKNIIDESYIGSGKILKQAIEKYGIENFTCEILQWCETLAELNEAEKYWIKKINAKDPIIGYNIADGGGSFWEGCHHSEKAKEKISNFQKNRIRDPLSVEHKQKISAAHKGKSSRAPGEFHHSLESRQKMSDKLKGKPSAMKGKHFSEESKQKLRVAHLGKKHPESTKLAQSKGISEARAKKSHEQLSNEAKKGWETRRKNQQERQAVV